MTSLVTSVVSDISFSDLIKQFDKQVSLLLILTVCLYINYFKVDCASD